MSGRKALLREYKERKVEAGIYAVRCVGDGRGLDRRDAGVVHASERIWFSLRLGSHREPSLQAAWNTHGVDAFVFEAVEVIDVEGLDGFGRESRLKERRAHWIQMLNAKGLN
jgi:hypothetical protein